VKTKTCPDCNGDGVIGKGTDDEQQCPTCGGSGFVPDDDNDEEVTRTKVHMATTSKRAWPHGTVNASRARRRGHWAKPVVISQSLQLYDDRDHHGGPVTRAVPRPSVARPPLIQAIKRPCLTA
jgi:hypothetical protein